MIRVARVPSRLAEFPEAARQAPTGMDIGVLSPETRESNVARSAIPESAYARALTLQSRIHLSPASASAAFCRMRFDGSLRTISLSTGSFSGNFARFLPSNSAIL